MNRPNRAPEIKRALCDVTKVLDALGILGQGKERQRQAGGWIIRCPVHGDRTPSCSVQLKNGEIVWKCHGCQAGGDVLSLVAAARSLSVSRDFKQILVEAARLAGLWQIVDELEGRGVAPEPMPIARTTLPPVEPERTYPPLGEVEAFWAAGGPPDEDAGVSEYLWSRGLNPVLVDCGGLARAIQPVGELPRWARCRFGDWREAGYRIVVPMVDAGGDLRSLRGWRVTDSDGPKRIPPFGHRASGLVMADPWALAWLRGEREPERVVVVEGEPDFLTWSTHLNDPHTATLGIVSGSWHEELAARFPVGCRVDVRTDQDDAGNRYAAEIEKALRRRCFVHRTRRAA